jgi:hypothetical protein
VCPSSDRSFETGIEGIAGEDHQRRMGELTAGFVESSGEAGGTTNRFVFRRRDMVNIVKVYDIKC